jgi:hypothetical protein
MQRHDTFEKSHLERVDRRVQEKEDDDLGDQRESFQEKKEET